MRVWQVILVVVSAGSAGAIAVHHQQHGVINPWQAVLASFLWVNVLIALWELCLLARIDLIAERHRRDLDAYRGRELARVRDFLVSRVPSGRLLSPTLWSGVWSSYAVFDDSYADRRSFGFAIDVGNGLTTLIPSLGFLYAMTFGGLPARAVGLVGALLFYQMWYGTLVYFLSFVLNRRYRGHRGSHLALVVGVSNGIWLIAPIAGIYASITLVYESSYAIFLR